MLLRAFCFCNLFDIFKDLLKLSGEKHNELRREKGKGTLEI